jgi:hypothetical protein
MTPAQLYPFTLVIGWRNHRDHDHDLQGRFGFPHWGPET